MSNPAESNRQWWLAATIGAIGIHPILGAAAYILGAVYGSGVPMSNTTQSDYGIQGGLNSLFTLLFGYVISFGILPIILSLVGARVGIGISQAFRKRLHDR